MSLFCTFLCLNHKQLITQGLLKQASESNSSVDDENTAFSRSRSTRQVNITCFVIEVTFKKSI